MGIQKNHLYDVVGTQKNRFYEMFFFEHPKQMFILLDKKTLTILFPKYLFIWMPGVYVFKFYMGYS